MKELNLIVRAEKLEEIKKILIDEFGCGGMTVSNVLGCGGQKALPRNTSERGRMSTCCPS